MTILDFINTLLYDQENFKKQDMSKEEMHTLIVDSITSYHMIIKELNDKPIEETTTTE